MKTALQQLIELEEDLTRMFDSDSRIALALLEFIRKNKKELKDQLNGSDVSIVFFD
jgi:hypothetical protein